MSTVTLIVILLVPRVVLGSIAMIAAFAFALRTGSLTSRSDKRKKEPEKCAACGHRLLEVLNYCPKCGAPIRPSQTNTEASS